MEHQVLDATMGVGTTPECATAVACVKELLLAFMKTVHAVRMYPPSNPMPRAFLDALCSQFSEALALYGTLALHVTDSDFRYRDAVVYSEPNLRTSIAFLLYKDGLRQIAFHPGLTRDEVLQFVQVFASHEDVNRLEDDYVTLLWEMNAANITYHATALSPDDAEGMVTIADAQAMPMPPDAAMADMPESPPLDDLDGLLDGEERRDATAEASVLRPSVEVTTMTPGEQERLQRECQDALHQPVENIITDILCEILLHGTTDESSGDALCLLERIITTYLENQAYRQAAELLQRLVALEQAIDAPEKRAHLRDALASLGDAARMERLARALVYTDDDGALYAIFRVLRAKAILPLITALTEMPTTSARKVLCDFLAEIGADAVSTFLPFLGDPRWFVVRNIVYILGAMGSPQSIPGLMHAYAHPDVRVRREVIQALGAAATPRMSQVFSRALTDEDAFIRGMAAVNLGRIGGADGLQQLIQAIQDGAFRKKEAIEVISFFQGIGATRLPKATDFLKRKLFQRSLFHRAHLHDVHSGAALALAQLDTLETQAVLQNGLRTGNASIRAACQQAMRGRHL